MATFEQRAYNRWQHLRSSTVLQLELLERDGSIPVAIAEPLRTALYEADEALKQTTFAVCER